MILAVDYFYHADTSQMQLKKNNLINIFSPAEYHHKSTYSKKKYNSSLCLMYMLFSKEHMRVLYSKTHLNREQYKNQQELTEKSCEKYLNQA